MEEETAYDELKDDFYSPNFLEESIDSDEIDGIEEGFMRGYTR